MISLKNASARLLLLSLLVGGSALAQDRTHIGIGIGSLDFSQPTNDPLLGVVSDSTESYKLFGGFTFSDHIGIEFSYGEADGISQTGTGNFPILGETTETVYIDLATTTLRALGQWQQNWGVLLGGLGVFRTDFDIREMLITECCAPIDERRSIKDDGLTGMLGIEWRFGRFNTSTAVRLEYELFDTSDADVETIGVAVSYRF